jgi:hypothetical protein
MPRERLMRSCTLCPPLEVAASSAPPGWKPNQYVKGGLLTPPKRCCRHEPHVAKPRTPPHTARRLTDEESVRSVQN